MWTVDFPYYRPPFPKFNVVQSKVVPRIAEDCNLVICFQTATGKTVLAECAFGYHLQTSENRRVAYVCPFKSLGEEKCRQWRENEQLSKYGVVISTSDHPASDEDLADCRIAIVTAESFDSKVRSVRYGDWVRSLSCAVFDEAHVMGSRNGSIEASLMRLSEKNPAARIILLSATLSNAEQLAKWVKSLNGKPTVCFKSGWRPVKLEVSMHVVEDGPEEKTEEAVSLVAAGKGKTLVFVHSKVTGAMVCKKLREKGIRAAFHNASVSHGLRSRIEREFINPDSGLDVVVATSTLGAGVNL